MKIVFLCGSFEPGRDGVGDYTRRLSLELRASGHQTAVISIYDRFVHEVTSGEAVMAEGPLPVLRIPHIIAEKEGFKLMKDFVETFDPDWLSLQYVPFSFHPKGLPFTLPARLAALGKGRKWEIMFHEIAVGMHVGATAKLLVWGEVQKIIARVLLYKLKPVLVHTHTQVYRKQLEKFGVQVSLLPLFSNIPLRYEDTVRKKTSERPVLQGTVELLVFAAVQEGAPIDQLAAEAKAYSQVNNVQIRLCFVGKSGPEQDRWLAAWRKAGLDAVQLGMKTEEEVSLILSNAVYGLFSTPLVLMGKSGAVAAMREHGIHLLCVARDWAPRGFKVTADDPSIQAYAGGNFGAFLESKPDFSSTPSLRKTSEQLINELLMHE